MKESTSLVKKTVCLLCIAIPLYLLIIGCGKEPILIGFVGGITGKMSDLGISGRNGLQMAVDEINKSGGINGRPVRIIIKDDKNDDDQARRAVQELIDQGADVIIGHMVSTMTMASLPIVNEHQTLMISPTTSTYLLSGKDDYFFRAVADLSGEVEVAVDHAYNIQSVRTVIGVLDDANRTFTQAWWTDFKTRFIKLGGTEEGEIIIDGENNIDYPEIARKIANTNADGVVLITNAFDTAMICQQLEKLDTSILKIPCGWSMTEDVIRNGGKSVEGMVYAMAMYPKEDNEEYIAFEANYQKRFGSVPDFAARKTYDSVGLIKTGVERMGRNGDLKQAILGIGTYHGIEGPLILDAYGDRMVQYKKVYIKNGEFVQLH